MGIGVVVERLQFTEIGLLSHLEVLDLDENLLTGTIPVEITKLSNHLEKDSFDHHDQEPLTGLLVEAAEELDVDVITLKTAVANKGERLPENVFVADEVPQTEVFPECLAIVHHGGAGTASQVIRSGRPGLCMPAMHFQQVWGGRLQDYGKAGHVVTQTELEEAYLLKGGENLLQGLQKLIADPEIQKNAKAVGEAARNAPGVEYAADTMVDYLKKVVQIECCSIVEAKDRIINDSLVSTNAWVSTRISSSISLC